MLTIQQLIKALRKLQNNNTTAVDLAKYLKNATTSTPSAATTKAQQNVVTSLLNEQESKLNFEALQILNKNQGEYESNETTATDSSQYNISQTQTTTATTRSVATFSSISQSNDNGSGSDSFENLNLNTLSKQQLSQELAIHRNQQIKNFFQQQLLHFHTQQNCNHQAKNQQQTHFAMSSLAAAVEPISTVATNGENVNSSTTSNNSSGSSTSNGISCHNDKDRNGAATAAAGKPCFNAGFTEMIKFMELIGNLKHTKRTGWVLRDVNDCESISGHMYRMSMMTFLLDGSEGLNQIRCMELALVHDLAESLVGDITPFCGVSKAEKRAMEFKAMDDICKLIEPRGKRIMELFQEYEHGESAESKFVKDLDRLDMVMQAFEYEKRDNCLLKHQEFFDSTEGKFNHPFVKKLVDEIYEQRKALAQIKGATPPPSIQVPDMDAEDLSTRNGHCEEKKQTNSNSS